MVAIVSSRATPQIRDSFTNTSLVACVTRVCAVAVGIIAFGVGIAGLPFEASLFSAVMIGVTAFTVAAIFLSDSGETRRSYGARRFSPIVISRAPHYVETEAVVFPRPLPNPAFSYTPNIRVGGGHVEVPPLQVRPIVTFPKGPHVQVGGGHVPSDLSLPPVSSGNERVPIGRREKITNS